ncbi:hypothetical protein L2E82_17858 [Cichorium intybus]|uniref:Uncharacterized protein n=1 Tax=Cichorium intybus TaxID=13427 RepID=A0ACB9F9H9_CICIN|nr:hypothetical protein L2E82_17858 [Cichorium intybus]
MLRKKTIAEYEPMVHEFHAYKEANNITQQQMKILVSQTTDSIRKDIAPLLSLASRLPGAPRPSVPSSQRGEGSRPTRRQTTTTFIPTATITTLAPLTQTSTTTIAQATKPLFGFTSAPLYTTVSTTTPITTGSTSSLIKRFTSGIKIGQGSAPFASSTITTSSQVPPKAGPSVDKGKKIL